MAIHGIYESTNCGSTHYAERIFDAVCAADVDNGVFGYLDGLQDGFDHIYKFVAGAPTDGQTLVVVDQPAWDVDECKKSNQRKDKFFVKAGTPFRARVLKSNDEFAVNMAAFVQGTQASSLVAGATVKVGADGKLEVGAGDDVFEGVIMRKRTQGAKIVTREREYGYSDELFTIKVK